jgi:hypothetical protein
MKALAAFLSGCTSEVPCVGCICERRAASIEPANDVPMFLCVRGCCSAELPSARSAQHLYTRVMQLLGFVYALEW